MITLGMQASQFGGDGRQQLGVATGPSVLEMSVLPFGPAEFL
jgi:hypothetical protein